MPICLLILVLVHVIGDPPDYEDSDHGDSEHQALTKEQEDDLLQDEDKMETEAGTSGDGREEEGSQVSSSSLYSSKIPAVYYTIRASRSSKQVTCDLSGKVTEKLDTGSFMVDGDNRLLYSNIRCSYSRQLTWPQ